MCPKYKNKWALPIWGNSCEASYAKSITVIIICQMKWECVSLHFCTWEIVHGTAFFCPICRVTRLFRCHLSGICVCIQNCTKDLFLTMSLWKKSVLLFVGCRPTMKILSPSEFPVNWYSCKNNFFKVSLLYSYDLRRKSRTVNFQLSQKLSFYCSPRYDDYAYVQADLKSTS